MFEQFKIAKQNKQLLNGALVSFGLSILFTGCLPIGGGLIPSESTSGLVEAQVETSFWDSLNWVPSHILVQYQKDCGSGPVPEGVAGRTSEALKISFDPKCDYTKISTSIGTLNGNQMDADAATRPGRELSLPRAQLAQHAAQNTPVQLIPLLADIKGIFKTSAGAGIAQQPTQQPIQRQPQQQQSNVSIFVVGGESCHNCQIFEGQGGQYHVMQSALSSRGNQARKIFYSQIQSQNISQQMKSDLTNNATSWPAIVAFNSQGRMCFSQTNVHQTPGNSLATSILSRCQ